MSQRYADQGLVIIGVHTTKGGDRMAAMAEGSAIPFPLAIDNRNLTKAAYGVDGNPDYYLVDRAGNLRVADLANNDLERAVKILLAESREDALHPALSAISAKAKKKNKRLLVMWGKTTDVTPILKLGMSDPALRKLIQNEYETVHLTRSSHPELAKAHGITTQGPALVALDAKGKLLQTRSAKDMTSEQYGAWLEQNRVPPKDAEVLWANALKEAEAHNKRVLVHLGAPW